MSKNITAKEICENWMRQADANFQEIKHFKELIDKADQYPFNKHVFCEFEIAAYHKFNVPISTLAMAIGCYYVDQVIPYFRNFAIEILQHAYTSDTTRLMAKPDYHLDINIPIYKIIQEFMSQMPCEAPVSVWDKAKTEFEKLSREEQEEYLLYITHPSAFWLHPKRWDDQDTTHLREGANPIWMRQLAPPENPSREIMKKKVTLGIVDAGNGTIV